MVKRLRRLPLTHEVHGSIPVPCMCVEIGIFFSCFKPLVSWVDEVEHLVISDEDAKLWRSRVHIAHVKDPLAIENRRRIGDYAVARSKFPNTPLFSYPCFGSIKTTDFLYNPLMLDLLARLLYSRKYQRANEPRGGE